MQWQVRSAVTGVEWPGFVGADRAGVFALLHQLHETQWLPGARLRELQQAQLQALLEHAFRTVPYYRERWSGCPPAAGLADVPLLTREDVVLHHARLRSDAVPREHGEVQEARTSGTLGAPVRIAHTALGSLFSAVLTLRDHAWHRRDVSARLAAIRWGGTVGVYDSWGTATHGLIHTGPSLLQRVSVPAEELLRSLAGFDPEYLNTYPSIVRALLAHAAMQGTRLPRLREVRTYAEVLPAEVRSACREAWGVPVTDTYSATEVGCMALQCPQVERHYHVQSEAVLVEVLNDEQAPCAPGEVGRVVVTTLHNFAMPLIRYEIGDYAEVGEPCACGRGLPTLKRILGRSRNRLTAAGGQRFWPALDLHEFIAHGLHQHQLRQASPGRAELHIAVAAVLPSAVEHDLRARALEQLPAGLELSVVYCDRIERTAAGKLEAAISGIPA